MVKHTYGKCVISHVLLFNNNFLQKYEESATLTEDFKSTQSQFKPKFSQYSYLVLFCLLISIKEQSEKPPLDAVDRCVGGNLKRKMAIEIRF